MSRWVVAGSAVAALVLAGCTSAVSGAPASSAPATSAPATSAPATSAPATSAPATSAPATSAPATTAPATTAPATSAPATTSPASPTGVAAPAACAAGGCRRTGSGQLDGGWSAALWAGPGSSGLTSSWLELLKDGAAVQWQQFTDETAGPLVCSPRPQPNCVAVLAVGAHASEARAVVLRGGRLTPAGTATADTPLTNAVDLDGDGWVDAYALQDTYLPTYATGRVYWQTFAGDGTRLRSTGCTAPTAPDRQPPDPAAFETGACSPS